MAKQTLSKKYTWMTRAATTSRPEKVLNGYGTEMVLRPVPIDTETGQRAIKKAGKHKGKPKDFTKEEWNSGKIQLVWMWPGGRIATLLSLLRQDLLVGQAFQDVTALKRVLANKDGGVNEGWARDIVGQEEQKLKEHNRQAKEKAKEKAKAKKKKLRQGKRDGEVPRTQPSRQGSTVGTEGRGKQELLPRPRGRSKAKGGHSSPVSGRQPTKPSADSARSKQAKSRVDSGSAKRRSRASRSKD